MIYEKVIEDVQFVLCRVCYVQGLLYLGFVVSRVCYVQGLLCLGSVMSRVCYVQGLSCLVLVMSRVRYVQGLLCLGFVMSRVCRVQSLLCLGFVVSRVCLVQCWLWHPIHTQSSIGQNLYWVKYVTCEIFICKLRIRSKTILASLRIVKNVICKNTSFAK